MSVPRCGDPDYTHCPECGVDRYTRHLWSCPHVAGEHPKGFEGPGTYSICPLCDEHFRYPDVPTPPPGEFWDPVPMHQALSEQHEAALHEHMTAHTAKVLLETE